MKLKSIFSHQLDSVRNVEFLDNDFVVSCSEDFTLCLWETNKPALQSKSPSKDPKRRRPAANGIAPVSVYRGEI